MSCSVCELNWQYRLWTVGVSASLFLMVGKNFSRKPSIDVTPPMTPVALKSSFRWIGFRVPFALPCVAHLRMRNRSTVEAPTDESCTRALARWTSRARARQTTTVKSRDRTGPKSSTTVRCRCTTIFDGRWDVNNAPHTCSYSPKVCTRSNKPHEKQKHTGRDRRQLVKSAVCEHCTGFDLAADNLPLS